MPVEPRLTWATDAENRLNEVPEGAMRKLTRQRVEVLARQRGQNIVTLELLEAKLHQWYLSSARITREAAWTQDALRRIERIPESVRGMIVRATEAYARNQGIDEISAETLNMAGSHWGDTGRFHQP